MLVFSMQGEKPAIFCYVVTKVVKIGKKHMGFHFFLITLYHK